MYFEISYTMSYYSFIKYDGRWTHFLDHANGVIFARTILVQDFSNLTRILSLGWISQMEVIFKSKIAEEKKSIQSSIRSESLIWRAFKLVDTVSIQLVITTSKTIQYEK